MEVFLNNFYLIVIIFLLFAISIAILGLVFRRRKSSARLPDHRDIESDGPKETQDEAKMHLELEMRRKLIENFDIRPFDFAEHESYLTDWKAVQSKFKIEPAQAIQEADQLIMQVMQIRAYPATDFEHRGGEISVYNAELVNNYLAASEIAIKNEQQLASTEEFKQAMKTYQTLFKELLGPGTFVPEEQE
jgi:hypothetical protein